jgi:predicted RNA-binding Zn ribbon-like protein
MKPHEPPSTASGELGVLQSFVNTSFGERREDFPDPQTAGRWLRDRALLIGDGHLSEGDWRRILVARQSLRRLLVHRDDSEALAELNSVAREATLRVTFGPDAAQLEPAIEGAEAVLGCVLVAAYEAMRSGEWSRLKLCANRGCARAFFDRSKNRSRTWCSMTTCGNRLNARAYRHRRAGPKA